MTSSTSHELTARLDRIPVWPYGRRLLAVIGAGYFFAYFDVVTIGLALPVITEQFGVSKGVASLTISSGLIGYIVGAFIDSRIADRYGRRKSLMISVCLFTAGSVAAAFSPGIVWLIIFRFVIGMGIGAEIAAVTTYLGELSPAHLRGRITSWAGVMAFAGLAVVPIVARVLVPTFDDGWRVLFLIGAVGGLTITMLRRELPPSIRWLVYHGRTDEAETSLATIEHNASTITGAPLPPVPPSTVDSPAAPTSLLRAPYASRLVLFTVMWSVYYAGNYGWLTLAPTLLTERGYSLSSSLSFLIVTGIGLLVGAVASTAITDRFERRTVTSVVATVWGTTLVLIGYVPGSWAIMLFGFLASTTIGLLIPVLYTYTAEHFPTSSRATGVATTDGLGHIGGAMAPVLFLPAADAWGFSGAFASMAVTGFLTALLLLLGQRTKGLTLSPT